MLIRKLLLLLVLLGANLAHADTTHIRVDRADVRLIAEEGAMTAGKPSWLAIEVTPDPGWHSYWFNPGDSGLAPEATWQLPAGVTAGAMILPTPVRLKAGGFTNYGFKDQMVAMVPFTLASGVTLTQVPMAVDFNFLVCEEICIPHQVKLSITLPIQATSQPNNPDYFTAIRNQWPKPWSGDVTWAKRDQSLIVNFAGKTPPVTATSDNLWFFARQPGVTPHQGVIGVEQADDALRVLMPVGDVAPEQDVLQGVLAWQDANGYHGIEISAPQKTLPKKPLPSVAAPPAMGLMLAVLLAFLGGALLNFMPCVFPVLALKIMAFVHQHGDRRLLWQENLGYAGGIVVSFLGLGAVMIALRQAGTAVGWGFQLQEPVVIWGLLVLFVMIGAALAFDLSFGSVGVEDKNPPRQPGWGRGFVTGVLVAIVASPCTAPMMAAALGVALVLPVWQGGVIFTALGLGLAVPMMAVTLLPGLARFCPRPGAWMVRLRQGLAFPMLGAAAWLLWVLAGQIDRLVLGWSLGLVLGIGFVLWLASFARRGRVIWLVLAIGLAIGGGVVIRPLPDGATVWAPYHPDKVAAALAAGQDVFVDATADWCITCLVNERVALADGAVQRAFADQKILLLKADWTRRDPVVTTLLAQHGRAGVPLYVFYQAGQDAKILPQILTPSIVLDAINDKTP